MTAVRIYDGGILISGGAVALSEDCCCDCDLVDIEFYDPGGGSSNLGVRFIAATAGYDWSIADSSAGTTLGTAPSAVTEVEVFGNVGQTFTCRAERSASCFIQKTCVAANWPNPPPNSNTCKYRNQDTALTQPTYPPTYDFYTDTLPSLTVVISGLTGELAGFNGSYTLACGDPELVDTITLTGSGYTAELRIKYAVAFEDGLNLNPYGSLSGSVRVLAPFPNGRGYIFTGGMDPGSITNASFLLEPYSCSLRSRFYEYVPETPIITNSGVYAGGTGGNLSPYSANPTLSFS